ncbi:MAG: carbohydrate kinase [Firmicutes bacterium]|mgnify:CR=1 FL=1|nr:carbohydrate kinase [Bacillota bacterium]
MQLLIGVDVGTTHCKAALLATDGTVLAMASRPTPYRLSPSGYRECDAEELWQAVRSSLRDILSKDEGGSVVAIGIASMAETGLLLDVQTGKPRTQFIPWFDDRAKRQVSTSKGQMESLERFQRTGLPPSFKYGLAKILWVREAEPDITRGALWLSAADYVAYRLTGTCATDYTLATRTYGFRIDHKTWDEESLDCFGLDASLFPPAYPSGHPLGSVVDGEGLGIDLAPSVSVAVSGHDHLCAALAVGATEPGLVYDSMGTAETLIGALPEEPLGVEEYRSGLVYGLHVLPRRMFWLGGLPSSGGSVEWLRWIMGEEPLSYQRLEELLRTVDSDPSEIIYFPYLAGSGAPWPNQAVRGAFVGLENRHGRGHMLKAVLEGTAYEMEAIRRNAETAANSSIDQIIVGGGGTQNRYWLQMKADISGCEYIIPPVTEATLLGAALIAGIGCEVLDEQRLASILTHQRQAASKVVPDMQRHAAYQYWYEKAYLRLQRPLREYYNTLARERSSL